MKRLIIQLLTVFAIFIIVFKFSSAFFSDTETSSGNTFAAGKIDLKVDNDSYYNGVLQTETSWTLDDLTNQLFFNFSDIKPEDIGEDTISLHSDNNDAWACMDIRLTEDDDATCTDEEIIDDPTCKDSDLVEVDGELAANLNFVFWADDGDNVLEFSEEEDIFIDSQSLREIATDRIFPLADSGANIWTLTGDTPLPGGSDAALFSKYIGKAWCFGELGLAPVVDGESDPTQNSGVTCNGQLLNNATQTDTLMGDVSFFAIQSRNNPGFLCKKLIETFDVPSTNAGPTLSTAVLETGKRYLIDVEGTYTYWPSCPEVAPCIADAEFSLRPSTSYGPGWAYGDDVFPPAYLDYSLDLNISATNINWGSYNPTHHYSAEYIGAGSVLSFSIYDDAYSDNSGSLSVRIYELGW